MSWEWDADGPTDLDGPSEFREPIEPGPSVATYAQLTDGRTWSCGHCLALDPDDPRHVPCWSDEG